MKIPWISQKLDTEKYLDNEKTELNPEFVDLDKLANVTMGFVGADLATLCSKAAISAITKAGAMQHHNKSKTIECPICLISCLR